MSDTAEIVAMLEHKIGMTTTFRPAAFNALIDVLRDFGGGKPTEPVKPSKFTTRRNEPCPCGSGKKFKKCCKSKEPTNAK